MTRVMVWVLVLAAHDEVWRKGNGEVPSWDTEKDLYPCLEGRNLARWVIRTSHIAIEPDTHLPQYPVRCQVDTGRTALELSGVLVSRHSMLIPLVPGSAGTRRERDGTAYSRSVLYASWSRRVLRRATDVFGARRSTP
jgi:hypothetical protein